MKKVVITGIHGQDGIILAQKLSKNKFKVIGFSNKNVNKIKRIQIYNIKNKKINLIEKLLNKINPHIIVHFGSTNPSFEKKFKKKDYNKNYNFSKFLIEYISKKKIKFIFPSSAQIFKKKIDRVNENSLTNKTNYYSKFRLDITNFLLQKKKRNKLNASIIILFNHDSKYRNKRFLLPRLIKSIREKKMKFVEEIYYQNINGDFSHADDICNGIYLLIKKNKNPDKIIFSSGKRTFINNIIIHFIPKLKLKDKKIQKTKNCLNIGNNSKAIKILGWKIKKNSLDAAKDLFKSSL